ncbi:MULTISPECIES: TetR/AcrR family transcriptional regulator [unclassified Rhodococcus (in: high G+C Gram-positive bacteria)]|uniref:TetR/AcrR family transcriptional regulator n=1 Tax=unclassified Rhodococcus (in: high G+C Gram-positive bacteria) TaxID=192944 RepID=UPI00163AC4E0|nr:MULTISPECIES: TetR family transcriptional regulator [unclassified Rhodococcus (in: high G+C Gram-positive bacteria)]MBC2640474.1 TetR/AcrR family transcriptional regulator [Rhodococcus sp. 3A]MBC2894780.1 TetR/AcrR family transcriptional regulator [Rhodococcus sp. 4CII]
MRSTRAGSETPQPDLTTRARVRDAAITVFGDHGFSTGVRAIATAAGVSPGLVIHHFGSKDGLRSECDQHVLRIIREQKAEAISTPGPAGAMQALADIEQYAPLVAYIVRSFQAGGGLGESLFEHMVEDTAEYLEVGVAAGRVRASRNPQARARYLTLYNVGALLLYLQMRADKESPLDYATAIRDLATDVTLPALEMYTEGLLPDSSTLEAYLATEDGAAQAAAAHTEFKDSPN